MPVVNMSDPQLGQPLPGWHDRYFHSKRMSFAYYDIDAGATIHEHVRPAEKVWFVIEGKLEFHIANHPLRSRVVKHSS